MADTLTAVMTPALPPPPVTFKAIGYVEKPGGQVEAVILQENQVQVVHLGDLIADRFRVTKVSPDLVDAVDETGASPSVAKVEAPPVAAAVQPRQEVVENKQDDSSLGFVQKADGKVVSVMADGEDVRLVPQTEMAEGRPPEPGKKASTVARLTTPAPAEAQPARKPAVVAEQTSSESAADSSKSPIDLKSLGYVEKANGEFAAIVAHDDEVYVVRQGDRFGNYRALNVSAANVHAVEEPAVGVSPRAVSADFAQAKHADAAHDTFIFQTLGYVETQGGETQAIVADGSETYLVKEGDIFADQYRATSVDPLLVLAVKEPAVPSGRRALLAEKGREAKSASKGYGSVRFPALEWASGHALQQVGASGSPVLTELGVSLLISPLAGPGTQTRF